MKVGIISQARMTSTRLPGKVLMEVNGKPLLQYHIDRLKQANYPVIIATTVNSTDDPIIAFATENNIPSCRGDENNVLQRYYDCATKFELDVIVRVTSDCPLIDGKLIGEYIEKYLSLNNKNIYMANGVDRTFARGFDFEIFSFDLLKEAYNNATDPMDLEHVTPYIWKNRSGKVEFHHVTQNRNNSNFRITVDTPEDFELIEKLISEYSAHLLSYDQIENILISNPELVEINAHIEQKKV